MTISSEFNQLGREVEIGKIEIELKRLWEEDQARTNASLINFAVYSEDASTLLQNSETVREVTREHACRALLIGVDRDQPEVTMRAWITAHCNVSNGSKSVCSEQIAFYLGGRVCGRLSNTVFAHLHSDLPLIFWWQGELTERFNERLYSLIQRLVIDSSDWSNPSEQFALISPALQSGKLVVQDLSWTRTYHLRLAIAAVFDDPFAQASIASIHKVHVVCSAKGRVAALQLIAWFAAQCSWVMASELLASDSSADHFYFESAQGGSIEVILLAESQGSAIESVEIEAHDVHVSIRRNPGQSHLHIQLDANGNRSEQSAPAECEDTVGLLKDQLSRGGKNSLFRKVYPTFIALLQRCQF